MKLLKFFIVLLASAALLTAAVFTRSATSQSFPEAPAGFDNKTNGMSDQTTFDMDRAAFEERDELAEGLGPVYNAQSCAECHQNPVTGSASQVTVIRAGHRDRNGNFVEAPGGSLINDRAIQAGLQETVPASENVRSLRISVSVLGDGFVEAIEDRTLLDIARAQAMLTGGTIAGQAIQVPLLEAPGVTRVGRFGWKSQHASLLSFSADAYLNEVGITSRLLPHENTSLGVSVAAFDTVADPEDTANDIDLFTRFMRATKVPPRDMNVAVTPDARAGEQLFNRIGCAICHVTNIITAPSGMALNGGTFIVPPALGSKMIHPYSDFLLHDVGTGDGIVQNGGQDTANKLRTAPLWGLRTRTRLMHDGQSLNIEDAIRRHRGEAAFVLASFQALNPRQEAQVLRFLRSL
ncbi:MAG TPA: di-heme oxidoredictase family protein [Blastocatellia bacterium]|nr:di-heme oxidoredictase family protein [Blastocatellia bacterium]HMY75616.1 di-heme oxidoredictase family protein [Blastocatellia bacterium]HMZ20011.1 di-heme oxidoredictase family protein [Blastocatellia bacterium]HNG32215.1 di-heme oxidoredictase family protein [Blastocatellia bacterium]